ncbi:hypothetical protein SAMN05192540_4008 [Maribacter dokdonensis]|uniref:Uncharacterized protein n=1 Tax=Maribacter dokdonensis TaxID=320912 RepID=A0A1H4WT54_9FLAO|nr:hypothetical protein SAMN05192540_4008 [Maribacter dokdonensis]
MERVKRIRRSVIKTETITQEEIIVYDTNTLSKKKNVLKRLRKIFKNLWTFGVMIFKMFPDLLILIPSALAVVFGKSG